MLPLVYLPSFLKHSHHSIEMDKENTDTWKHKQAGANLVVGVGSTTFFNVRQEMDLNRILFLLKHMDEFDFVIVFDESWVFGEESDRWLYTAITRAKEKLLIVR